MSSCNPATRLFALLAGTLTGAGGIAHGVAEVSLGNVSAADILPRVGAFTLLPTYLTAGIATIALGAFLIAWSIARLHEPGGPTGFALIAVALLLSGGGVAHLAGLSLTWVVATRIRAPLIWWSRVLPASFRVFAVRAWPTALAAAYLFLLSGVALWLFFMPPVIARVIGRMHYLCWSCLLVGFSLLVVAIPLGFARDLAHRGKGGSE